MNTKEFIRVKLDASANMVHAWLGAVAATAEQIDDRSYSVVSLEINFDSANSANSAPNRDVSDELDKTDTTKQADGAANAAQHHRRYGVVDGRGVLVVDANMNCPSADTTVLELRRDDSFPLVAKELMRRLYEHFTGVQGEVLAERTHGRTGAPPLACNVWLEERMRQLPDPKRYHHLYNAWLAHYVALRGFEPLDARRSFRAAASGCLKRMRAQDRA